MKYLPLVWAGLWRKPLGTAFTFCSITIAFLLFGMLRAIHSAFDHNVADANLDRLYVWNRINLTEPLPIAYLRELERIPGVAAVTHATWTGTYYRDPKNVVYSTPVDPERYLAFFPEITLPAEQMRAWMNTRAGAVISTSLAQRFGWKVGDLITLHSVFWTKRDGTSSWTFNIVGIFANRGEGRGELLFNYNYFDEARSFSKGTVGWYIVRVRDPGLAAQVGAAIDRRFANSSDETNTQTEKSSARSLLKQLADMDFILTAISGTVFFTLLLLIGNNMAQSVRERMPEIAVLKSLGFADALVFSLVFAESLLLCELGAFLGLTCASAMFPALQAVVGFPTQPLRVVASGLLAALLLALAAGIGPAWRAKRLQVVDALAGR